MRDCRSREIGEWIVGQYVVDLSVWVEAAWARQPGEQLGTELGMSVISVIGNVTHPRNLTRD
jgi:hypothetical protein